MSDALPAFLKSCAKLKTLPPDLKLKPKLVPSRISDWLPICEEAAKVKSRTETEVRYFFESRFSPYRASNDYQAKGLFTGYFEPELRGAWQPNPTYRFPIYAHPKDLVSIDLGKFRPKWKGETIAGRIMNNKITPYPTRAEINGGILKGKQLELLWVDNAIDAFFFTHPGLGPGGASGWLSGAHRLCRAQRPSLHTDRTRTGGQGNSRFGRSFHAVHSSVAGGEPRWRVFS